MAKLLSDQYHTAFSQPVVFPINMGTQPSNTIGDIQFSEEDIIKAIDELDTNSAPGPDRFPAIFLKKCKHKLAKPLYIIYRKSLDQGVVPDCLKLSHITPIYKDGSRKVPKNYRPVALTSHLSKVFEKIVRNSLVSFIEKHNLMNPNQHGFRKGHSCLSQLLQHQDNITALLEQDFNVDIIYLDFSKAFDKLDIRITLQKLFNLGIVGKLFYWTQDFLTNRKQCVIVGGTKSDPVRVKSGVPQGSVIGPLLFLILLEDINKETKFSTISSFADDTRVLSGIRTKEDVSNLQNDLDTVYRWAQDNNAVFNPDKFECIRYGLREELKSSTSYLANNGETIKNKNVVRDLGVRISNDATFAEHITIVAISANQKCGWILRTFRSRDQKTLMTLWKSLVIPLLDYCCQVWSPNKQAQIISLENVQRHFLNKVESLAE